MNNLDLNIDNYKLNELERLFNLNKRYSFQNSYYPLKLISQPSGLNATIFKSEQCIFKAGLNFQLFNNPPK